MRNQVLGNRYRIQERIGEGGMAFVYVAVDEKLGRRVAIKVLHEHMEKNQDIRKRFQMEAQAISSLDHPNIVKIYDFSGEGQGRLWIVTEVIKGQNLAQYVQQFAGGWLHPIIAACTVREILKALYTAHANGIVHRDVKPENVMMTVEGQVKLMDFGIAKDLGKSSMTLTGTFMGSPSYMSPEQIRGRDVDLRSDLYSLSVLFYEIVTGRLPFTGQTTHDVVLKIMEGEFTYPRFLVPSLPDQMDAMIVRGMGKDPAHRFQTATDFGGAIDAFLAAMGFDESHIELERFFKDPAAYDERLKRTKFVAAAAATQARNNTRPLTQQMGQMAPLPPLGRAPTHRISKGGQRPTAKQLTQAPPRPATQSRTRSAELPAPPPFRADATWQGHVAQAQTQRVEPPPPAPPPQPAPPRAPTQHQARAVARAHTQVLQPAVYAQQAPAVDPGTPRRQAGYAPRRNVRQQRAPSIRVNRFLITDQSWLNYVFGVALVGLIGLVSVWGFIELSTRLAGGPRPKGARIVQIPLKGSNKPAVKAVKGGLKKANKIKNGTPVVVKQPVKKALVAVPAPAPAGKAKLAKKPKTSKWAGASTTIKQLASAEAADPNLSIETVEIKKTAKAKDELVAETTLPATTTAPAPPSTTEAAAEAEPAPTTVPAPPKVGRAKVTVASDPAAEVFIDGRRVGTTVDQTLNSGWIELKSGKHRLELRRQGYATYRSAFELNPDDARNLPRVNLEAAGSVANAAPANGNDAKVVAKGTALTLRVNTFPAQVTIRNIDNNTTQTFTMKAQARVVQLDSGRYQVKVERKGEIRERELNLTGAQGQLTFTADFKGE